MPNIRLLELEEITDPAIRALIGQAEARGAPDPNFFRIMGHVPELCTRMYELWTESFNRGRLDHRLKELVRVKMSRYVACQY